VSVCAFNETLMDIFLFHNQNSP